MALHPASDLRIINKLVVFLIATYCLMVSIRCKMSFESFPVTKELVAVSALWLQLISLSRTWHDLESLLMPLLYFLESLLRQTLKPFKIER